MVVHQRTMQKQVCFLHWKGVAGLVLSLVITAWLCGEVKSSMNNDQFAKLRFDEVNQRVVFQKDMELQLAPFRVFLRNQWWSNEAYLNNASNPMPSNGMFPLVTHEVSGTDNLGPFYQETIEWTTELWNHGTTTKKQVSLVHTSFRLYPKNDMIVFEQMFPLGVQGCAGPVMNQKDVLGTFPNFQLTNSSLGYFAYDFLFLERNPTGRANDTPLNLPSGVEVGPILWFQERKLQSSDEASLEKNKASWRHRSSVSSVAILSHFNEFMTQSISVKGRELQMGPFGTMCDLPPGYSAKSILVFDHRSIQHCAKKWGQALLNTQMGNQKRMEDYTTLNLGYSTDNGAYYYYQLAENTSNYQETMHQILNYAKSLNIPYKYWLLDSWWYYQDNNTNISVGLGVTNWTARPDVFPDGLANLFKKTHMFVQAHNRYWAPRNAYQHSYQFEKDDEDERNQTTTSLPTERRFWDDLFQSGLKWGLRVYEQDWLNVQFEYFKKAYTNATLMSTWLNEMGDAAASSGITLQYCMPLGRFVLQTSSIPSVTQIRASDDYVTENQWNIGITSLLYNALDLKPSKDSAWSETEQPGNRWHRRELYPDLQMIVMALSTGPVTFADRIGFSHRLRILRTCRSDGILLQPMAPLVAIHEWFYQQIFSSPCRLPETREDSSQEKAQAKNRLCGHVQETRMKAPGLPKYHIVLAVHMQREFELEPKHLHRFHSVTSLLSHRTSFGHVAYSYQYDVEKGGCISQLTFVPFDQRNKLIIPVSITEKTKTKTKPSSVYSLFYIAPLLPHGDWLVLGELAKVVPISPQRLLSVEHTMDRLTVAMQGAPWEEVKLYVAKQVENEQGEKEEKEENEWQNPLVYLEKKIKKKQTQKRNANANANGNGNKKTALFRVLSKKVTLNAQGRATMSFAAHEFDVNPWTHDRSEYNVQYADANVWWSKQYKREESFVSVA